MKSNIEVRDLLNLLEQKISSRISNLISTIDLDEYLKQTSFSLVLKLWNLIKAHYITKLKGWFGGINICEDLFEKQRSKVV